MPDLNNICMGCMGNKGDNVVCPSCGFNENEMQSVSFMPIRTLLDGRYLIGAAIDSNCEGVTYLAWDTEDNAPVRVREYFPDSYCARAADGVNVNILSGKEYEFDRHIGQFIEIARCLARCSDLPSLFPITDIFESNNTAYFVTEHVKTITMREFLIRNGGSLSWDQIRPLLMPVITTLSSLHNEGLIHCGISPETLIVGVDGRVRITGFCVPDARTQHREIGAMNAQLFPGFAAIEQYESDAEQGTWTDVYGMCATLYKILVGSPPADATERITNDKMIIPAKIAQEIPRNVLSTLADGLAILSDDRTQTMDDLKNSLIPTSVPVENDESNKVDTKPTRNKTGVVVAITIGALLVAMVICIYFFVIKPSLQEEEPIGESNAPAPSSIVASLVDDPASADTTYPVPNLVGVVFGDAIERDDIKPYFKLDVVGAKFDSTVKGTILSQNISEGTMLKGKETIQVTVSLGNTTTQIPATKGLTQEAAIIELMKCGFDFNNIVFDSGFDTMVPPNAVTKTTPAQGEAVSIYSKITIHINTYDGSGNTVVVQSTPTSSESVDSSNTEQVVSSQVSSTVSGAESKTESKIESSSKQSDVSNNSVNTTSN